LPRCHSLTCAKSASRTYATHALKEAVEKSQFECLLRDICDTCGIEAVERYRGSRAARRTCIEAVEQHVKRYRGSRAARRTCLPRAAAAWQGLGSRGCGGALSTDPCQIGWGTRAPACVSIRQHTSAYVSIRQHTSAYVSIRQHTSAEALSLPRSCSRPLKKCFVKSKGYGRSCSTLVFLGPHSLIVVCLKAS
jgi:hypothetical protein